MADTSTPRLVLPPPRNTSNMLASTPGSNVWSSRPCWLLMYVPFNLLFSLLLLFLLLAPPRCPTPTVVPFCRRHVLLLPPHLDLVPFLFGDRRRRLGLLHEIGTSCRDETSDRSGLSSWAVLLANAATPADVATLVSLASTVVGDVGDASCSGHSCSKGCNLAGGGVERARH